MPSVKHPESTSDWPSVEDEKSLIYVMQAFSKLVFYKLAMLLISFKLNWLKKPVEKKN
jgi:uncharacterized membrane protein (DUF485 family)